MKIFALFMSVIQDEEEKTGMYIRVGEDGYEVEKKLKEEIESYPSIKKGTVKTLKRTSMSIEELANELKPELEKMVKTAKAKSQLLDLIGQLPVN